MDRTAVIALIALLPLAGVGFFIPLKDDGLLSNPAKDAQRTRMVRAAYDCQLVSVSRTDEGGNQYDWTKQ